MLPEGIQNKMDGRTVWFTGLSGAGKTTLSLSVHMELVKLGVPAEYLDADELRLNLTRDLGFTKEDRDENIRRIGFVAKLLTKRGIVALVAAIAPYRAVRQEVRDSIGNFIEVYVNAPLAVCEERDVKGLYKKARAGEIHHFTGIDDPYEPPLDPEVVCNTATETVDICTGRVVERIIRSLHP
jgi:adenylylsulfate kinase